MIDVFISVLILIEGHLKVWNCQLFINTCIEQELNIDKKVTVKSSIILQKNVF